MKIENLFFSYGNQKVIKGMTLFLAPGQCMIVMGPNGSGKSTLLLLMAGALKPDSGMISVPKKVGYVPQGTALFEDMTVAYNYRFFAALSGFKAPERLPFSLDQYRSKRVSALSEGNKKRLSIACALLGNPELLLLDEPCASLDIHIRDEIISVIHGLKDEGKTIVLVSHDPAEFVSIYDSILFLNHGISQLYSCFDVEKEIGNCRNELLLRNKIKSLISQGRNLGEEI